jgi:hypothetical protein
MPLAVRRIKLVANRSQRNNRIQYKNNGLDFEKRNLNFLGLIRLIGVYEN